MEALITTATGSFKDLPNIAPDFGNDWLANAHEISLPRSVSYMPNESVIFFICLLVIILLVVSLSYWYLCHCATQYRRQAIAALNRIETAIDSGETIAISKLPELLKRVALTVWPRHDLASLTNEQWLQFWRLTTAPAPASATHKAPTPPPFVAHLGSQTPTEISAIKQADTRALLMWSRYWIATHRHYIGSSVAELFNRSASSEHSA